MNTWTHWRIQGLVLTAALCLVGLPASAAIINVPDDQPTLEQAVQNASADDTIVLQRDGTIGDTMITLSVPLSIDKNLTIMGENASLPYQTVIEAGSSSAFDVFKDTKLVLQNLAIAGAGAINASEGAKITLNQILFDGVSAPAVRVLDTSGSPAQIVIVNSCFSDSGPAVITELPDSEVYIYQTTFRDMSGSVLQLTNASATILACLLDNIGGFEVNSVGITSSVTLSSCYPGGFDAPAANIFETNAIPSAANTPLYIATAAWPGKLAPGAAIETGLAYPGELSGAVAPFVTAYADTDFEGQLRGNSIQVGADEVDALAIPGWENASVSVDPVGKNKETIIRIETGFALDSDASILIVPESIMNDGATAYRTSGSFIELAIPTGGGTVVDIPFTPTSSYLPNGALLDGEATIILRSGNQYFDGSDTDAPIFPGAINGRKFVIDTFAPVPNIAAQVFADGAIVASNDNYSAISGYPNLSFPAGWGGIGNIATNDAAFGNAAGRKPVALFNTPASEGLDFTIQMVFDEVKPQAPDGDYVTVSGFPTGSDVTTGTGVNGLNNLVYNLNSEDPVNYGIPFWEGSIPASLNTTDNNVGVQTDFGSSGLQVNAQWTLTDMPYDNNGWNMDITIVASDLAGNVSETGVPLGLWWIDSANGAFTATPDGASTTDPRFGWAMDRSNRPIPGDVSPLFPIASVRLWGADTPGDENTSYTAITGWSPFTASTTIDRNSIVEGGTVPVRLGTYLDNPILQGAELMLTAVMADEAGNVQPFTGFDDTATTIVNRAALNSASPQISWAIWTNNDGPGVAATRLDTSVSTRFWHNRADNTATIRRIDAVEKDFGDSRRIPLPDEEDCYDRVEGRFNVQLDFPDDLDASLKQFARWELYEDGRLVATGFLRNVSNDRQTTFTLQIPEDLVDPDPQVLALTQPVVPFDPRSFLNAAATNCGSTRDRLGDEGNSVAVPGRPRNRLRNVNYVLTVAAGYGLAFPTEPCVDCVFDISPASVEFTVALEREVRSNESPVIVNEKLAN